VLYATITATRTSGFLLGVTGTTIVTIAQVLTRSRAGWLACAAALVAWATAVVVSPPVRRDPTTRTRMIGVLIALGLGVAAAMLLPNTLRWRSENPYLESMRGVANFQEGSGHGRLIQYRRTLRIAGEDPVLGAGPGNWAVEYPKYAARNDPSLNNNEGGTTSNPWPSSDWVAFIAEHGLPATLMLLLVFTGIALRATQRLMSAWTPHDALAGAAALATVFGTLVAGMFDAVLLLALPTLIVWATLGALWSPARRRLNLTPRTQGALLRQRPHSHSPRALSGQSRAPLPARGCRARPLPGRGRSTGTRPALLAQTSMRFRRAW
jgi:O-antigen ligase